MENAIFISFDDNYSSHAFNCIASIKRNYPHHPRLLVNYTGKNKLEEFQKFFDSQCELIHFKINEELLDGIALGPINSSSVFTRFVLWSEMFGQFNKILHLDADTLVLRPLDKIFEFEDFYAVSDHSNTPDYWVFKAGSHFNENLISLLEEDKIKLPHGQDDMLNAGVFLIPRKYRTKENYSQLWRLASRYNEFMLFADQSIISLWCHLNNIPIQTDYEFNFQVPFFYSDELFYNGGLSSTALREISILHFCWWKPKQTYYDNFKQVAERFLELDQLYSSIVQSKYSLNDVSVVISLKVETLDRIINLQFVLKYFEYYFSDVEIIIVEQDSYGKLEGLLLDNPGVKHVFIKSDGCHYKTRNLNTGIALSCKPIIMILDCDILCKPEGLKAAVERLREGADFISPHNGITVQIKKHFFSSTPAVNDILDRTIHFPKDYDLRIEDFDYSNFEPLYGNSQYDTSGGAILCKKEALVKIGGWNTNFISFGYEDMEFIYRVNKLGYKLEKLKDHNLYHLEHERSTDSMLNNFYRTNERAWEEVCAMSKEELQSFAMNGFKKIIFDNKKEFLFKNNEDEYSLKTINSVKIDLSMLSVVVPVSFSEGSKHEQLSIFLNNFELYYNNYQIILVEYASREFKYPDNKKNIKYLWSNDAKKDDALQLGIAYVQTPYLAVWDINFFPEPKQVAKELNKLDVTEETEIYLEGVKIMKSERVNVS